MSSDSSAQDTTAPPVAPPAEQAQPPADEAHAAAAETEAPATGELAPKSEAPADHEPAAPAPQPAQPTPAAVPASDAAAPPVAQPAGPTGADPAAGDASSSVAAADTKLEQSTHAEPNTQQQLEPTPAAAAAAEPTPAPAPEPAVVEPKIEPTTNDSSMIAAPQEPASEQQALADNSSTDVPMVPAEQTEPAPQESQKKTQDMPTRQYLDSTVVPILHAALSQLAKVRPEDPIGFLSTFLIENKNKIN